MFRASHISNSKRTKINKIIHQANQAFANAQFETCEQLCRKVDKIIYGLPNVLNLRGLIAASIGKLDLAEQHLTQAVEAVPRQLDFLENLARIYAMKGQPRKASQLYQKAIRLQPVSNKSTVLAYCDLMIELKDASQAIESLLTLLEKHCDDVEILMTLATSYFVTGNFEETRKYCSKVLELNPNNPLALRHLGMLASQEGRLADAEQCYRNSLAISPQDINTYANLVLVKKFQHADDEDIVHMEAIQQSLSADSDGLEFACFALGKVYDDLKNVERAFYYFNRGNTYRRQRSPYNVASELEHMQQVMNSFTAEVSRQGSDLNDQSPLFITGMPRCGSTLTDQIITSHPNVTSKGECNVMEGIALARRHSDSAPLDLQRLVSFTPDEWQQVGVDYLEEVKRDVTTAYISDKSLNNIRLVGAIHCAMPKAKIIHVRRHPLDTCLSIYKNNLAGELFGFGSSLEGLGNYYQAYQLLMAHWKQVLPAGVMLEVNYEDLVRDQEGQTRRLLDFCNLEWDDACLQFHQSRNRVQTSSVAQVRKPIYKDSVAAWQRYEKHLQPLIDILGTDGWPATE